MEALHLSPYLIHTRLPEDKHGVASALSGTIVIIPEKAWEMLVSPGPWSRADLEARLGQEMVAGLMKAQITISAATDTPEAVAAWVEAGRQSARRVVATFTTTLACNQACRYCFQGGPEPQAMGREVMQQAAGFVGEVMRRKDISTLVIHYFGGEPLLRPAAMVEIRAAGQEHLPPGAAVCSVLTTNGVLLDSEALETFRHCGGTSVQVTLDGPEEIHQERRPAKNGQPTYRRILTNIAMAAKELPVAVRVNIDRDNLEHVPQLLADVAALGVPRQRLVVDFVPVQPFGAAARQAPNCLSPGEYALALLPLYRRAMELGLVVTCSWFDVRRVHCQAYSPYAYVFAPDGMLYKCDVCIGAEKMAVGHLFSRPALSENYERWVTCSVARKESCLRCEALGFCGGGCLTQAAEKFGEISPGFCSYPRQVADQLLATYLDWKREFPGMIWRQQQRPLPAAGNGK